MYCTHYIDIGKSIGKDAYKNGDFENLRELLDYMDYFQIDRTVVHHQHAVLTNPTYGNKALIHEIAQLSEAEQRRIIPSMVIAPACYYEHGALDNIKSFLASGNRALTMCPNKFNFVADEILRVLNEVKDYNPVVFCPGEYVNGIQHFALLKEFFKKHQEFKFVVTGAKPFSCTLDLLYQSENIYVDISHSATWGAMESICNNNDTNRILFALGKRSDYGGAIAALSHADVAPDIKEKVAHSNVEKLLALEPVSNNLYNMPDLENKKLWKKFREGKAIDELEIIDIHCHSVPWGRGWHTPINDLDECFDEFNRQCKKLGINHMYIIPESAMFSKPDFEAITGNEKVFSKDKKFSGLLFYNPHYEEIYTDEFFDKVFASGYYKGLKVLPSYLGPVSSEKCYDRCWAYAHKHKLPILMHTWSKVDIPDDFERIAEKYPDATFIFGHSGGQNLKMRERAEDLAIKYDNIYLEFCGSMCCPKLWEESFKRVPYTKLLFGSDTAAHSQSWELGRLLSIPIPDDKYPDILAGNVKRIMVKQSL